MLVGEEIESIQVENEKRMISEVGAYHANEAVKEYNAAIQAYSRYEIKDAGEEQLIIHLKRAIPHLVECRKLEYNDSRLKEIMNGIQHVLSHGKPSDLNLLRL